MNKLSAVLFLIIACIFGIVLAVDIGTEDYEKIGIYVGVAGIIYFVVHGWKNIWWFTAILIFSGVVFSQGFVFAASHLFVLMLLIATLLSLLNHDRMPQAPEIRVAGSRGTTVIVGLLLAYGTIHFLVNRVAPYSPNDYSLKTSAKAYFECYASMVCFFWLLIGPYGFKLKANWVNTLLVLIFFGLAGNVAVRTWMFLQGFQAADGLSTGGLEDYFLYVPVINMQADIYALRELCPTACLLFLMIGSTPGWWRSSRTWLKALIAIGLVMSLVGALMSGGRVTFIFCLLLAFLVSLYRKQIGLVGIMGCVMVLLFALVNLFSFEINTKAPMYVSRSLQTMMIDKGEASYTIGSSQDSRNAAFKEALVQWRMDNRVLFFGRSVFRITGEDAELARELGEQGFIENAMRSGRTHNLITDLLLQYGIVGLVLYLLAYVRVIFYFQRLRKVISPQDGIARSLAASMAIYLPLTLVYQLIGGNYMPIVTPLVIGLIRAHLTTYRQTQEQEAVASQDRPAGARAQIHRMRGSVAS